MVAQMEKDLMKLYSSQGMRARLYAKIRMRLFPLETFDKYLPEEGTVIDLGCGYGLIANYLALRTKDRQVRGIDTDAKRIKCARQTIQGRKNIEFAVQDVVETEIPLCDSIIMIDFLHHLPVAIQNDLLRKLHGKLKDGGILLISEVDTIPRWKYWFSYLSDCILYPFSNKLHFRSSEEMQQILSKLGYEVKIIRGGGLVFARVTYICRKRNSIQEDLGAPRK